MVDGIVDYFSVVMGSNADVLWCESYMYVDVLAVDEIPCTCKYAI